MLYHADLHEHTFQRVLMMTLLLDLDLDLDLDFCYYDNSVYNYIYIPKDD
jgi:hypothetical protein